MSDDTQNSANGGNVNIRAGDGGPNGNGADITIIGGTIRAGDGGSIGSKATKKRWFETVLGAIVIGVVASLVAALLWYWFGPA